MGRSLDGLISAGSVVPQHAPHDVGHALGNAAQQQPIAEKIEAEFLARAVGHVAGVSFAAGWRLHRGLDYADRYAQRLIERTHPVGVAASQVIVDRRQMSPLAGERFQIHRQRGCQCFSFARLHLGNRSIVHGDAAQELHVEMAHVQRPPSRLAHQRKSLGQQLPQGLAATGPVFQRQAAFAQLAVGKFEQFRLELRRSWGSTATIATSACARARPTRPEIAPISWWGERPRLGFRRAFAGGHILHALPRQHTVIIPHSSEIETVGRCHGRRRNVSPLADDPSRTNDRPPRLDTRARTILERGCHWRLVPLPKRSHPPCSRPALAWPPGRRCRRNDP